MTKIHLSKGARAVVSDFQANWSEIPAMKFRKVGGPIMGWATVSRPGRPAQHWMLMLTDFIGQDEDGDQFASLVKVRV